MTTEGSFFQEGEKKTWFLDGVVGIETGGPASRRLGGKCTRLCLRAESSTRSRGGDASIGSGRQGVDRSLDGLTIAKKKLAENKEEKGFSLKRGGSFSFYGVGGRKIPQGASLRSGKPKN